MSRDTTTGKDFEDMISIKVDKIVMKNNYTSESQKNVGIKPGGGKHFIDHVIYNDSGEGHLISCKTQNTSGTAEEKLAYEAIKVLSAIKSNPLLTGATIVLGGAGFSKDMLKFIKKDIFEYIPDLKTNNVKFMNFDDFLSWDGRF